MHKSLYKQSRRGARSFGGVLSQVKVVLWRGSIRLFVVLLVSVLIFKSNMFVSVLLLLKSNISVLSVSSDSI